MLCSGDEMPHITWCATGPVAFLPLHAAGIYNTKCPLHSIRATDFVISSYTPSLSALIIPPKEVIRPHLGSLVEPSILVVTQPDTPGLNSPLPCTVAEAAEIRRHFPAARQLEHSQATVGAVLAAMEGHSWVHLACHGAQNPRDPTKSAFFLYNGQLELSELMGTSLAHAELAVLSACQTAKGDENLPEEAVHLAAGMLAVGFRSVVATLWSIADDDGPVLADALYSALKKNHRERQEGGDLKVAHAMHEATANLRNMVGEDNFARWVPFVHFGL
jgi:CHAT domain-containing protein